MANRHASLDERWWAKVDQNGPLVLDTVCWLWTGHCWQNGYGAIANQKRDHLAHRVGYELLVGPIPEGLQLDHLCRNRRCVNPAHLEPVTNQENRRRYTVLITHCPKGHPYDETNTYVRLGKRNCRICCQASTRLRKQRVRAARMAA